MPTSAFPRLLSVLLVFTTGTAFSQSLADVLSSIQERQRAVEQSRQVEEHLDSLNGGTPTISDQDLIEWTGLGEVEFPTEGDLDSVAIDGRVALLNQAVSEFRRIRRSYLNLRAEDLATSSKVGALRPFMREDFPELGRADASNYHEILNRLANQVIRLSVLSWPVAGIQQYQRYWISKWECEVRDSEGTMTGIEVKTGDGSVSFAGWEPVSLGPAAADEAPNTDWQGTSAGGVLSEAVYTRNSFSSSDYEDEDYGSYTLRSLDASMVGDYFSDAMLSSSVPGGRTDQIGGKVALLARSLWTPASTGDYTAPTAWNNQDASYTVILSATDATGSEALTPPSITLNLQWFDTGGGTRRGLPEGFSGYKQYLQTENQTNWAKSWEKFSFDDYQEPIVLHRQLCGVAAPDFEKGLNSGSKAIALESAANYTRPPSGDAIPEIHPTPGILLGVPIGVGMEGDTGGWIGWSPGDILFHATPASETPGFVDTFASTLLYPITISSSARLIRFDHGANLRFMGPAQDFHVVYETSRIARGASLPTNVPTTAESDVSGWDGGNGLDDTVYPPSWKNHFFAAWDAPRLRQVVSRDFIVDITHTGHYSSEIKIYRRPVSAEAVDRTPGHLETPDAANLIRTLVCTNPSAGTNALPAVAEKIEMTDGSNKYEVWRDGLEAYYAPSTQPVRFRLTQGTAVKWSRVIEFPSGMDAKITTTLDTAPSSVDELSGAWPYGEIWGGGHLGWSWWDNRAPLSFKRTADGKVVQITNTIDEESPGSQLGSYPAASLIKVSDKPDLSIAWKDSGLVDYSEQGSWRTEYFLSSGSLIAETKLGGTSGPVAGTIQTDWSDGERKVKTTTESGGGESAWIEIEYGDTGGTGLPGLPHIVRNSGGTGATYEWSWISPTNSRQLTLTEGLIFGNSVSRGTRIVSEVNQRGYPAASETFVILGGTLKTGGSVLSDFNDWGMPRKSTDYNTGLDSTWAYSGLLSRIGSATSPLGVTTTFTNYDAFGRPGNIAANGISAAITRTGFGRSAQITGAASGTVTENRDALGRFLGSNTTWNGVVDNLTVTPGGSSTGIARETLLGTYNSSLRNDDGYLTSTSGPTLAFGGTEGTSLEVDGGLLKSTANLRDQTAATQITWTDAWGRLRKTETPSSAPTGSDETEYHYELLDCTGTTHVPARSLVIEASGRRLVTETDPYDSSGIVRRSGIDVSGDGKLTLGSTDRYVESVSTVSGSTLVTTLWLTENGGLREILRTTWTPSGGQTVTKVNFNEETITRTPNYGSLLVPPTVTTASSKGWSKTETFNNLGLATNSTLSGAGIPSASLSPAWRADGSLEGVSLIINGETHSATFNHDGTLATLTAPGRGNILGGHSISGGVETLTVYGVTKTTKLDGTQESTIGGDAIGKVETLKPSGSGFLHVTEPNGAAATATILNAAGAPVGKNYSVDPTTGAGIFGESYTSYQGGLIHTVSLARGGSLEFGYSDDGAKDLTSATWPQVTSGNPTVFTIPAIAEGYGYDRAGRTDEIGDASGVRNIDYQNGRLKQTIWNSGPLAGYKVVRGIDDYGRETGFELWRGTTLIHSASKTFTGTNSESDEVAGITSSGGFSATYAERNGARYPVRITRGPVTQRWQRGSAGRITLADSDSTVSGAPTFSYTTFDAKGRRKNCLTAGGEWVYQYTTVEDDGVTAGQIKSAVHPTLGSFTYQFDGIGRRKNHSGSVNWSNLLNQTEDWQNSQNKTLKIDAHPDALVWLGINNATPSEITGFTGSHSYAIPSPGNAGGWVAWNTLAVLEGQGEGAGSPPANPLASPDAKAEQSGAVWVPPISESFDYDAAGNRESSALWDYGWDAKNQLVRARTKHCTASPETPAAPQGYDITNAYDAEGRRFRKAVNRYQNGQIVEQKIITFLYNGDDLIYEREQLPSGLTTCERRYVWGPDIANGSAGGAGGLLLIRETKGDTTTDLYPLYDGTGHVVALADSSGALQAEYAYGPFGEKIYARGPKASSCPFRFQTKYLDQETGLYCYKHRAYDPVTGQWLSRDPLGESETLNLYSLTGNDPINFVDADGLASVAVDGGLTTSSFGINALLGFSSNINAFDTDWWEKASKVQRQTLEYLAIDIETAKLEQAKREYAEYKAQFTPMAVSSAFSRARITADPDSYIFYRNYLNLVDAENPLAYLAPARHDGGFIPYLDNAYDAGGENAVYLAARPMQFLQGATSTAFDMSPLGAVSTLASASGQFKSGHSLAGVGLVALAVLDVGVPGKLAPGEGAILRIKEPRILGKLNIATEELSYLRKQYIRKRRSLERAASMGELRWSPETGSVRIPELQDAYRSTVASRFSRRFGREIDFSRLNADHPVDLIIGGSPTQRLRMLDESINKSIGASLYQAGRKAGLSEGNLITEIIFLPW
jgi:RHS repeat-associated protein